MIFYRKHQTIQAITLDLDDTLYDNHPYIVRAEQKLREFLHQQFPVTQQADQYFWKNTRARVVKENPHLRFDMGQQRRHILRAGLREYGYQGDTLDEAVELCFNYFYFHRSNFKVDKTICSLLSTLAQKLPLVAITNGNVNLEQIGISEYFQLSLHASGIQPMKPHPMMFDMAREHLGLPAKQILHVGDNLQKDIFGAHRAGFQTAWYAHNREMQLSNEQTTLLPDMVLDNLHELESLL